MAVGAEVGTNCGALLIPAADLSGPARRVAAGPIERTFYCMTYEPAWYGLRIPIDRLDLTYRSWLRPLLIHLPLSLRL